MDSSISDMQSTDTDGDPYFNLSANSHGASFPENVTASNEDLQMEASKDKFPQGSFFENEERMDTFGAKYSFQEAIGSLPSASLKNEESSSSHRDEMNLQDNFITRNEEMKMIIGLEIKTDEDDKIKSKESSEQVMATSPEKNHCDFFSYENSSPFHSGEHSAVVSEVVVASTHNETAVNPEIGSQFNQEPDVTNIERKIKPETCFDETADNFSFEKKTVVTKVDMSSEDEEVSFDKISAKSGAESSSSKDGSPSGPSCSGTSLGGVHSLSSDSEDEVPNRNISLPIKKRKRESLVETVSNSSSCSEDESKSDIDYSNLTADEIKALIKEAKRYGSIKKKCRCPKKKWSELPVKGPTETSSKCTIGKGDWSEKLAVACAACASGVCVEEHKRGRCGRRKNTQLRTYSLAKTRARGTIGQDVPIIELSDSEEMNPMPSVVASEVTISAVPAGECIVLSSSEDDDDIVCEGVIKAEPRSQVLNVATTEAPLMPDSPDVVVLGASCSQPSVVHPLPMPSQAFASPVSSVAPALQGADSDLWPDFNVDLDETLSLLADIVGPLNAGGPSVPQASAAAPNRPPTPEGWSCPICLESKTSVSEIMSTTCGHVFCGDCIRSAVRIHKKCPTCRKKLTMKQFHKIFL